MDNVIYILNSYVRPCCLTNIEDKVCPNQVPFCTLDNIEQRNLAVLISSRYIISLNLLTTFIASGRIARMSTEAVVISLLIWI
jgi:hypothetical protein